MLTNQDLYKKYGDNIVFLFKGDEPYVEKYGAPAGVLIEKNDKVLCYECQQWRSCLGKHVRAHGMTPAEYREKYGFNRHTPISSRKISAQRREINLERMKDPIFKKALYKNLVKGRILSQAGKVHTKKRIQALNARNVCPEQMIQRYKLIIAKYGTDVSSNIVKQIDSGLFSYGQNHFGSWNNFKQSLGLSVDTSTYKKDIGNLIYDLRDWVDVNSSLPWETYSHRRLGGFPHSMDAYIGEWGSFTKAMQACGLSRSGGWLTEGKKRKLDWVLIK